SRQLGGSGTQAGARGIEQRQTLPPRRTPLAQELDLEALGRGRERSRNVAECNRAPHAVTVSAGSHPTHDTPGVPDRLIARGVGIGDIDAESREAQGAGTFLLLERRCAADKVSLSEIHEAAERRLVRTIDR